MRRALALLGGALVICVCARAGQGAEREPRPPGRHVDLLIGATTPEADLLESSVRDLLASKGLSAEATRKQVVTAQDLAAAIAPPSEATPSVGRVLVDLTVPGQATLFLIDPRRGRVFVRRMTLTHGLDAVARASVRFVVEQSIDAILEGRDIGVSREEFQRTILPPAPLPPPPTAAVAAPVETQPEPHPAAPVPGGADVRLAVGYEALAMGSSKIQQAGKVVVAAYLGRLEVAGAARLAVPMSVSGGGADARLWTGGLGVSAAGRLLASGALSLVVGVGGGVDLTHVAPAVTAAGLEAAAAFWAPSPWLQPFAELERRFGDVALALAVGAEIHPLAERYAIEGGSQTVDLFVPWRVRPAAQLTLGYVF